MAAAQRASSSSDNSYYEGNIFWNIDNRVWDIRGLYEKFFLNKSKRLVFHKVLHFRRTMLKDKLKIELVQ